MKKKLKTKFICIGCKFSTTQWLGRCPECQEWNSLEEEKIFVSSNYNDPSISLEYPRKVTEINKINYSRITTGISEFDRVLGGGIVSGSLILVGGEPGIGKSTLLTDVLGKLAINYKSDKILYISGEESSAQVASRSRRLGIDCGNYLIYHQTNWQKILAQLAKLKPKFIVIDSIQTTLSSEVQSAPGTISQIREVTFELMNYVKSTNITCFLIGHITKEGSIAGPKILEHMVDTVIYFEGDQLGQYRMLRAIKNRFGNTNEIGIFEMKDSGLQEVKNPSQYFLDEQVKGSFGRSLTCVMEGSRSLFVEIQALVIENKSGNPRRTSQDFDTNRLAMLIAVIEKYFKIPLAFHDIYLNIVGGMKLKTRESDLSIIASLLSSYKGIEIDNSTIFLGEVGLTGEVRSVSFIENRLNEMNQLNYSRIITSEKIATEYNGKYSFEMIGISLAKELNELLI